MSHSGEMEQGVAQLVLDLSEQALHRLAGPRPTQVGVHDFNEKNI